MRAGSEASQSPRDVEALCGTCALVFRFSRGSMTPHHDGYTRIQQQSNGLDSAYR